MILYGGVAVTDFRGAGVPPGGKPQVDTPRWGHISASAGVYGSGELLATSAGAMGRPACGPEGLKTTRVAWARCPPSSEVGTGRHGSDRWAEQVAATGYCKNPCGCAPGEQADAET